MASLGRGARACIDGTARMLGEQPEQPEQPKQSDRSVWQIPGFRSLTVAFSLARLPVGLVALTIVLAALERTGSLQVAGLAEACYIGGMAVGSPAAGRLVDRFGTSLGLLVTGGAHVLSLALLAAVTFGSLPASAAVFFVLSAGAGATVPPAGPIIRTTWNDLVPPADLVKVNALESTLSHTFYVVGAGALAAATWLGHLGFVFVACSILNAAAVALLLLRCASAVHLPRREHAAPLTAVFRQPGAARVLSAIFGWALTLAGLEYAIIGWAAATNRESLAAVLIGVTAVGAVLASAVLGGRRAELCARISTPTWMVVWAVSLVPLALVAQHHPAVWLITIFAVLGRLPSVGSFTALIAHTTRVATAGLRTETFSWRMTAHLAGSGAGTAACGMLAEHLGAGWVVVFGIVCALGVAALLAGTHTDAAAPRTARQGPSPSNPVSQPVRFEAQRTTPVKEVRT